MSDIQFVKEELDSIDDKWKQARFDSLPHVVEILTCQDPEEALQRLRDQRDEIEDLVDDVVRGYHNGFNRAIHNYSQILRLFSESAASISGLKKNLGEAKNLLGTRHKQLQQLWYRSVTLRHVISLLDQIDNVSKVPARIDKLIAEKRYYAAVQLHVQSISMLEREGIQTVGALQDVRADLSKLKGTLFFKVVEDLHLHLYNRGEYSENLADMHDKDDDLSNLVVALPPTQPVSRRTRAIRRHDSQISGSERASDARGSVDGSSVDGREDEKSQNGDLADGGVAEGGPSRALANGSSEDVANKDAKKNTKMLPVWLAEATPNEFTEVMTKSEASWNVKYLQTLVECLALLGKIAAAGAIISQRLRPTVHDLIITEIKACAAALEASRPRVDQVSKTAAAGSALPKVNGVMKYKKLSIEKPYKTKKSKGEIFMRDSPVIGPVAPSMGPMGMAQISSQELLEHILATVTRVLENHVVVGEMLESRAAVSDLTGSPSKKPNGDSHWSGDTDVARATGGYSLGFALTVVQSECQQLICDILRATPDAASADAAVQTARLASKMPPDNASNGTAEEGLSFAFRFTDTVLSVPGGGDGLSRALGPDGLRHGRNRRSSSGGQEGYGTGAVLSERGIYLTSAVYRPVLQFTDKVSTLLPKKYSQLGKDGLQSFIENFIKDQFLPIVRVDYRTRVAESLASPAAFRPRSRPGASYRSSVDKGRPVLQGPLAANQLVTEVLGWAQSMPVYAGEFLELVHTLLERTLERCRAVYTEAVLGSLSSSAIGKTEIANLMKQESAHSLLEAAFYSEVGQKLSSDLHLDAESLEVEMELNNLLLSIRPIKQEQLINDDHKFTLLASLSDSLDYLSESMLQLGQKTTNASQAARKKRDSQHPVHHHRRTSSTLTAGLGVLAEKYRALSSECLRTLRVEMQLEAIYHLQAMVGRGYTTDQDAEEPEDFVVQLTSTISRRDEELAACVPSLKRNYIFGGVCSVAAMAFIKVLNDLSSVNMLGIRQICRNCIALQQALAALASSSGNFVQQSLDRVRTYYELLNLPFEALIAFVTEHDKLFTFSEYSSLLKVNVPGREIPQDAFQRIGEILAPGL